MRTSAKPHPVPSSNRGPGGDAVAGKTKGRSVGGFLRFAPWLPLCLAGGYMAWLVTRFSRIIDAIQLNPDATWAPVLARDLGSGPRGGLILVGAASHLTSIWFLVLTRSLPFREQLWEWAPYLVYLAGLGLATWACWRVAGRWAALLTLSLGVGAGSLVLLTVMSEGIHGHTFFADSALAACLVWYATRPEGKSRLARLVMGAVVVAIAGATLASDPLFVASGLAPLLMAPFVVWLLDRTRRNRRLAILVAALGVLSVIGAIGIWRVVHAYGFRRTYQTTGYALASPGPVLRNLREFAKHVLLLGNGLFFEHPLSFWTVAQMVMAVFVAGAVAAGFVVIFRLWRSGQADPQSPNPALMTYVAYWVLSALGVCAAFSLSSFTAGPSDHTRYVMPAFFALAAIGPVWGRNRDWRRVVATAGVSLFCLISISARGGVFAYEKVPVFKELIEDGPRIIAFLEREGVTQGYGGYFNSHPLTHMAEMKVHFYPVIACNQPVSEKLCPFSVNTRTAWYRLKEPGRTFLIYDASAPAFIASAPLEEFGAPSRRAEFGDVSISIYDYDIARRFSPPCPGLSGFFTCPPRAESLAGGGG